MQSNSDIRVMVVHTGRRDNYEVSKSFSDLGLEVHLVTDFYYEPDRSFARLARIIFRKSVLRRHRADLNVSVHTSIPLLATDFLERIFPRNPLVNKLRSHFLGQKARSVISRHKITNAIYYYNSGAHMVPDRLKRKCRVTLFQMHPHPTFVRKLYDSYIAERPQIAEDLFSQEEEMTEDAHYVERLTSEALSCDNVICTSSFTYQSLRNVGVNDEKILTAPYGFPTIASLKDIPLANSAGTDGNNKGRLNLAFVGQFVVRKGVYELISLLKARQDIQLNIYTRDEKFARKCIERWFGDLPINVYLKSILSDRELWADAARTNDFLILPSIIEGFGLVITESMAYGLPVICSTRTVGPDVIDDGSSGFIIEGFFKDDIEKACDRALEAKDNWPLLRENATRAATQYSWEAFRAEVRKIL